MTNAEAIVLPFLKWAGGKRWLTAQYSNLFPRDFETYLEPFLGSGAVFFHLRPASAILSDANEDLIRTYREICANWHKVQRSLARHHRNHSKKYYYLERARKRRVGHELAAQFIYLNRTCWNGLYRVNLRGEFNVPIGTKTAVCLDTDDFKFIAQTLRCAELVHTDFEATISMANRGDFLFLDPPYITRHNFNGFVKYNDKIFSWQDQERLARVVRKAAVRGVKILMTNANHASVRALYQDLGSHYQLDRHSVLAADASNRGTTTELAVVINYEIEDQKGTSTRRVSSPGLSSRAPE